MNGAVNDNRSIDLIQESVVNQLWNNIQRNLKDFA